MMLDHWPGMWITVCLTEVMIALTENSGFTMRQGIGEGCYGFAMVARRE
jgi:hypothetical protein